MESSGPSALTLRPLRLDDEAAFIAAHNLFRAAPFRVEQFTLFSSERSSSGSIYSAEAEYLLT